MTVEQSAAQELRQLERRLEDCMARYAGEDVCLAFPGALTRASY